VITGFEFRRELLPLQGDDLHRLREDAIRKDVLARQIQEHVSNLSAAICSWSLAGTRDHQFTADVDAPFLRLLEPLGEHLIVHILVQLVHRDDPISVHVSGAAADSLDHLRGEYAVLVPFLFQGHLNSGRRAHDVRTASTRHELELIIDAAPGKDSAYRATEATVENQSDLSGRGDVDEVLDALDRNGCGFERVDRRVGGAEVEPVG
jgi:hypothetical protein